MTKISYIHGIGSDEFADRAKQVPAQTFINYSAMTDGELKVALMGEQLKILAAYYPEVPDYKQGLMLVENSLYAGIHGGNGIGNPSGLVPNSLRRVLKTIRNAKKRYKPAATFIDEEVRPSIISGINTEVLIPVEDCKFNPLKWGEWNRCRDQNAIRNAINQYWEKSAYHPLYEFITNKQASRIAPAYQGIQAIHKTWMPAFGEVSDLAQDNLRTWMRNGVMRSNAEGGISPLSPEDSIQVIADEGSAINGINEPLTAAAIIGLVTLAIGAAQDIIAGIQARKQAEAMAKLQGAGFGTNSMSSQTGHFLGTDAAGTSGLLSGNTPLLLGAAAGLLLIVGNVDDGKGKKKRKKRKS